MKLLSYVVAFVLLGSTIAIAGDVHVKGYYRKDGTYVRPHVRSSPDNVKWNNYGPSQNDSELTNPRARDNDNDGIPNYQDFDSDNDGLYDDNDHNPYGRNNNIYFDDDSDSSGTDGDVFEDNEE